MTSAAAGTPQGPPPPQAPPAGGRAEGEAAGIPPPGPRPVQTAHRVRPSSAGPEGRIPGQPPGVRSISISQSSFAFHRGGEGDPKRGVSQGGREGSDGERARPSLAEREGVDAGLRGRVHRRRVLRAAALLRQGEAGVTARTHPAAGRAARPTPATHLPDTTTPTAPRPQLPSSLGSSQARGQRKPAPWVSCARPDEQGPRPGHWLSLLPLSSHTHQLFTNRVCVTARGRLWPVETCL